MTGCEIPWHAIGLFVVLVVIAYLTGIGMGYAGGKRP